LIAFFTGYRALQDHNRLLAMDGAWLAFAAAATALHLFRKASHRSSRRPLAIP
jgi:hypothetical protein